MKITDIQIKDIILTQIKYDSSIDSSNITAEVANGQVRLSGTVQSLAQKNEASRFVWSIRGVRTIDNQLRVTFPPESALLTDSTILRNAKTAIRLNAYTTEIEPEISVDKGVVTLSGIVDALWKAKKLENTVSELAGVKDVASLLSIVPTENVDDEIISNAVIESFKQNQHIDEEKIIVTVANGRVTLQGTVLAARTVIEAYKCASRIRGVKDVVNKISMDQL